MKIGKINIVSFGGLKNKQIDFSGDFSVIYGDNENGKSTVMAFIKMMFYGTERGSSQISKNPRKKYAPWDGSPMAGSIDFEAKGKNYRLEREFKSSNSTDRAVLTDLDLGEKTVAPPDIGVKLFGLSAGAFERSVFIGQSGFGESDSAAEGEINGRLSNIALSGDESVSYDTVNRRLEKARLAIMSKSGRAGEYDKNVKLLNGLKEQLNAAEAIYKAHGNYTEYAAELTENTEKQAAKAAELKKIINSEQDIRNAAKLKEMLAAKEELDKAKEEFCLSDGGVIYDMYVGKVKLCLAKLEAAAEKLNDKTAEVQRLTVGIETAEDKGGREKAEGIEKEISALNGKMEELENKITESRNNFQNLKATENAVKRKKHGINTVFAIASIIALFAALVFLIIKMQGFAVIAAALAAAFLILSFILRPADKRAFAEYENRINAYETKLDNLQSDKSGVLQQLSILSARLEAVNTSINMGSAVLENQRKLLLDSEKARAESEQAYNAAEKTLFELYGSYKPAVSVEEIKGELNILAEKAEQIKQIKQRLNYLVRDLNNISYDEAREKLAAIPDDYGKTDFEAVKAEYEKLNLQINANKQRLAAAKAEDNARLNSACNPNKLKKEIGELESVCKRQAEFCRAADMAMQVLRDSFAELRRSYGSELENKAGKIFAGITGGAYSGMQISKSFDISAEKFDVFGGKDIAYLSSGTADQAYLSLRLALSELIFLSGDNIPVFLDDALAQYDDGRAKKALEYLKGYSKNHQIIMFTCHNSFFDFAKEAGADCKRI